MNDERLEVFALDEFEKLKAGAVEEVVAGHGIVHNVEDGGEIFLLGNLLVVEFILEADTLSEELQCS